MPLDYKNVTNDYLPFKHSPLGGMEGSFLLHILGEVGQVHIALATESVVHSEGSRETMVCLTAGSYLQIVAEHRTIVRMCTVLDDEVSALHWALATKVGDTLLGNDNVHVVL